MPSESLWSGNLATPRRTVLGVFGMLERSQVTEAEAPFFLLDCGLPPIAIEEPDVPITRDQQLLCMSRLLDRRDPSVSIPHQAAEVGLEVHITLLGMLGLTMMYAPSLPEVLRVICTYSELSWGHSRLLVSREDDRLRQTFVFDGRAPGGTAARRADLRSWCVTVDLTASIKFTQDLFGPEHRPTEVWLPYPAPEDHRKLERRFPCPVRFDAPDARVYFPVALWRAEPLLAQPLVFRTYEKLTAQLARRLRTDIDLSEQVRRLLWTSSPPPDRDTVARMLAVSPRTLARKLSAEETSYGDLHREVRLARATEYLRNRTLQVAEVAERLGFSDAAAFTRAFRGWTGQTPSEWRTESA